MNVNNLFNSDDRAVSPVIGVILMVAITVILAAVIGTFVLGLGDSLGDNQPTAQLSVDVDVDEEDPTVTVNHNGGDSIAGGELRVVVSNATGESVQGDIPDRLSVGDSVSDGENSPGITVDPGTDYRVRIIHDPSDSVILDRSFQAGDDDFNLDLDELV